MPRRRSSSGRKSTFDFSGASYPKYNPAEEGYGSPSEWASMFNVRMGFKEAQAHKAKRGWGNDWTVVGDAAGVHIDEKSIWAEVKSAFRAAATKCHPGSYGKISRRQRRVCDAGRYLPQPEQVDINGRADKKVPSVLRGRGKVGWQGRFPDDGEASQAAQRCDAQVVGDALERSQGKWLRKNANSTRCNS